MSARERLAAVDRVMRQHRRWLIAQEAAAARVAAREVEAARRLLLAQASRAARSSAVADAQQAILERTLTTRALDELLSDAAEYRRLQQAARAYGDRYAQAAVAQIDAARAGIIVRAQQVGVATSVLQYPEAVGVRVGGMLQLVPVEKVSRLAGLGASTSPLRSLQSMGEASSMRVLDAMIGGAARGESPRRLAERIAGTVSDAAASDVLRVTRSEMLRASRASTAAWTDANAELMDGSTWYAELDDATCAACWAQHGTHLEVDEIVPAHPGCRCAALPRPKSPDELGFHGIPDDRPVIETGESRFAKLDADARRKILGPKKASAYEDGSIRLADVVRVRHDERWGSSVSVGSLDHALRSSN